MPNQLSPCFLYGQVSEHITKQRWRSGWVSTFSNNKSMYSGQYHQYGGCFELSRQQDLSNGRELLTVWIDLLWYIPCGHLIGGKNENHSVQGYNEKLSKILGLCAAFRTFLGGNVRQNYVYLVSIAIFFGNLTCRGKT